MEKIIATLKSWRTTALSIAPLLLALLTGLGVINLEQQAALQDGVVVVFDSAENLLNEVSIVIEVIVGIGLILSKDGGATSEEVGLS